MGAVLDVHAPGRNPFPDGHRPMWSSALAIQYRSSQRRVSVVADPVFLQGIHREDRLTMAYNCDTGDGNQASMLITNLEAGETLALCGPDFVDWIAAMHQTLNDKAAGETATAPDPVTGDDTDDDAARDTVAPAGIDPYTVPVEQGGLNPIADPPATAPATTPPAGDGVHVNPVPPGTAPDPATV